MHLHAYVDQTNLCVSCWLRVRRSRFANNSFAVIRFFHVQHWCTCVCSFVSLSGIVFMIMHAVDVRTAEALHRVPATPAAAASGVQPRDQLPGEQVCTASPVTPTCSVGHTPSTTPIEQMRASAMKTLLARLVWVSVVWIYVPSQQCTIYSGILFFFTRTIKNSCELK